MNIVKPGRGVNLAGLTADKGTALAQTRATFSDVLGHMVPQSFFEAVARNEALPITFFAIVFAVALSQVEGPAKPLMLSM